MFDFIKKMFGEGKIRAKVYMPNGDRLIAKVPYIGDITTLNERELKSEIDKRVFVEDGMKSTKIEILGWY